MPKPILHFAREEQKSTGTLISDLFHLNFGIKHIDTEVLAFLGSNPKLMFAYKC